MKWKKYSLMTTTQAVDFVSDILNEIGITGIEVEDKIQLTKEEQKELYIDILPELGEDDGVAKVSFYLEEEEQTEASASLYSDGKTIHEAVVRDDATVLIQIKEKLAELSKFVDIGEGSFSVTETQDADWANNWKAYFKSFRVDEGIVIKPTWEVEENLQPGDMVVEIDPGTAFGTGSHETTRLCIQGIREYLQKKDCVLDLGCGSGILSIVSLKLGAQEVFAVDIDPVAVQVTKENASINGIKKETIQTVCGNILEDASLQNMVKKEYYDVVVANILAEVIIPLSKQVTDYLKPGGYYISSGIICEKREKVEEAVLASGLKIIKVNEIGEWVSIVAQK